MHQFLRGKHLGSFNGRKCFAKRIYTPVKWHSQTSNNDFSIVVEEFELPKSDFSTFLQSCSNIDIKLNKSVDNVKLKRSKIVEKDGCDYRKNKLNIQMLSHNLHKVIFKGKTKANKVDEKILDKAQDELKKNGLWQENVTYLPDVHLKLPTLLGSNIAEHFEIIGEQQSGPYKRLLLDLVKTGIPQVPQTWLQTPGWTMYKPQQEPVKVDCPLEDSFVFDVEVCRSLGEAPTMACAVSNNAWYSWVCPELCETSNPVAKTEYCTNDFIPLESKQIDKNKERIIVGHNVSYDRARVKEQYYVENSLLRFLDTMSLHICVGGVTSYQKSLLKSKLIDEDDTWREYTSLNSLSAVHMLYCKTEISKQERNVFVEGNIQDIRNNFQNLVTYCANDVIATYNILQKLLVIFLERFQHPVTLAGMLEMGTAYLPINNNWRRFIVEAEQTYEEYEKEVKLLLTKKCDNACRLIQNEEYKNDLWMWDEKWDTQELKVSKNKKKKSTAEEVKTEIDEEDNELENKYQYLFYMKQQLPVKSPHLPGYPLWYRKLCEKPKFEDWVPGPQLISTSVKVTPKLLNLMWENYPLHHTRKHGWGLLVADLNFKGEVNTLIPFDKLKKLTVNNGLKAPNFDGDGFVEDFQELVDVDVGKQDYWDSKKENLDYKGSAIWCNHIIDDCCFFLKLPHKSGLGNNVGNPLAKDFLKTFTSSVLSSNDKSAVNMLTLSRMLSYWRNNCERIMGQLTVWLSKKELPRTMKLGDSDMYGVILPQVVVCGTLTRRGMERTWMTASNAYPDRIGSELRSMVQAPSGYNIVGADVDSQELWIASIIGDSHFAKQHGATPLGWMTLSGHKSNGTDMHSVTAKAAGITRDHAKVLNYARIYGAGQRFTQRLLKQFNPSLSEQEAKKKAQKMFLLTKGKRCFKIKPEVAQLLLENEEYYSNFTALRLAKQLGKPVPEIFDKPQWINGTESAMFNRLEEIASSDQPKTPFLGCRLSRALEPKYEGDDSYLTTKINWVVQSGAVDYLHLMLVCMRWLTNGHVRFCLSFHDEVRYLVESDKKYETALALHITNLLTRSFCSYKLGLYDLPQSVAFFTSVEVDTVLRKEANLNCVTPSNPHGLEKGYNIKPGESLSIYDVIEKCGGSLAVFNKMKNNRNVKINKT